MSPLRLSAGTRVLPVRWIAACVVAETLGMTAAAAAATAADGVAARPDWWATPATALAIVVAGGLVEGLALGWAQSGQLRRRLPALRRSRYVLWTLLVAGLGWSAASAPAVLAPAGSPGNPPALPLVLLGAAGIGLVMGPVLGAAQGLALRGAAARPTMWVVGNTCAWPPAMVVIFLGATSPGATWPTWGVVRPGGGAGAAAGAVLGLVTGAFLTRPPGGSRRPASPGRVGSPGLRCPSPGARPRSR